MLSLSLKQVQISCSIKAFKTIYTLRHIYILCISIDFESIWFVLKTNLVFLQEINSVCISSYNIFFGNSKSTFYCKDFPIVNQKYFFLMWASMGSRAFLSLCMFHVGWRISYKGLWVFLVEIKKIFKGNFQQWKKELLT